MSKKLYPKVHAGEKVLVKWRREDYKMACCDCGLVHRLRFNVKGGTLVMRAWRENRATGQIRRRMKNNP